MVYQSTSQDAPLAVFWIDAKTVARMLCLLLNSLETVAIGRPRFETSSTVYYKVSITEMYACTSYVNFIKHCANRTDRRKVFFTK